MFGKGSGKECRLHVQKLNDLKRISGDNYDLELSQGEMHAEPAEGNWDQFVDSSNNADTNYYDQKAITQHYDEEESKFNCFDSSSVSGNQEHLVQLQTETERNASTNNKDKSPDRVLLKRPGRFDANTPFNSLMTEPICKKRKEEDSKCNDSTSKWFQFMPDQSDEEEEKQQKRLLKNAPRQSSSSTNTKNIFRLCDFGVDDIFNDS